MKRKTRSFLMSIGAMSLILAGGAGGHLTGAFVTGGPLHFLVCDQECGGGGWSPPDWHKLYNNDDNGNGVPDNQEPQGLLAALEFSGGPMCDTGSCFVLSHHRAHSTDYRAFKTGEMIHIGIRANHIFPGGVTQQVAGFVDPDGNEYEARLYNQFDGTYTAEARIADFPSDSGEWRFFAAIQSEVLGEVQGTASYEGNVFEFIEAE